MKKNVSNVCMVDTIYTLFLYMIIVGEKKFNETFFFCSQTMPQEIIEKLNQYHCFKFPKQEWGKRLFRIILFWSAKYRFPFLKYCKIYGGDNYFFSSGIVGNRKMILIEDGIANYSISSPILKPSWIKRHLMGPIAAEGSGGISTRVEKIILTGLSSIPKQIKEKVEIVSIQQQWNILSENYKEFILSLFNFSLSMIDTISKYDNIFLTQPMAEDGLITKEEEVNLYKRLLEKCNKKSLLIKVHPRDTINYQEIFPEAYILNAKIPMEVITLIGIHYKDVYTVFSTAALSLPYKTNIHFMGTSVHPNLLKHRGLIEYNVVNKN